MAKNESPSDYILIDRLNKGDVRAFDQIFEKYGNRLFGFALNFLKSKEEAEELVQEVFLKVWENRKKLKKETSFRSYLFTIAYHDMCQIFRKKQIHERFLSEGAVLFDSSENLDKQLEYKATLEQVEKIIDQLPEKQRLIFIKSRKEGKSSKEIAKEMRLASGTVDNQISLALKFLRKKISENNFALLLYFSFFIQ